MFDLPNFGPHSIFVLFATVPVIGVIERNAVDLPEQELRSDLMYLTVLGRKREVQGAG